MKTRVMTVLAILSSSLVGCAAGAEGEDVGSTADALQALEYDEAVPGESPGSCGHATIRKYWGGGCYVRDGDYIRVRDASSDGRGVAIYWRAGDRHGICRSTLGAGVEGYCNKNLPEGKLIYLMIGRCDQSGSRTCREEDDYVWAYTERDST
jgi:hypothetical protein